MTANESNELLAGLELTTIVNQLRDSRVVDEVILFTDIPRVVGHLGTSDGAANDHPVGNYTNSTYEISNHYQ